MKILPGAGSGQSPSTRSRSSIRGRSSRPARKLGKGEILFVAFAGWDVAGARWFGYPTFWNNRQGAPAEGLAAEPDGAGATLNDVVQFLAAR